VKTNVNWPGTRTIPTQTVEQCNGNVSLVFKQQRYSNSGGIQRAVVFRLQMEETNFYSVSYLIVIVMAMLCYILTNNVVILILIMLYSNNQ